MCPGFDHNDYHDYHDHHDHNDNDHHVHNDNDHYDYHLKDERELVVPSKRGEAPHLPPSISQKLKE